MGGFAAGKEALTECRRAVPTVYGFEKGYDTRLFPVKTGILLSKEHHQWLFKAGTPGAAIR